MPNPKRENVAAMVECAVVPRLYRERLVFERHPEKLHPFLWVLIR